MIYFATPFRFLIVIVLALGLFFRFANIDRKIFWYDEAFTLLRISGYTEKQVAQQAFNGFEIDVSSLQKFQRLNPEKKFIDTVQGLAIEEPQIAPLYFLILRLWAQLFNDSVIVVRSLSAVISLFTLPCIYWLCQELFKSPTVGWIAVLLVSISPYHVIFAQDARMYSLWAVTTLLSSASLLQALRLKTRMGWATYTVTLAVGFYTHFLTLLTAFGHGLYIAISSRGKFTKTIVSYLLSSVVGLLLFFPWLWVLFSGISQAKKMTSANIKFLSIKSIISSWIFQPSRIFLDFNVGRNSNSFSIITASLCSAILLTLTIYSFFYLYKNTSKSIFYFIIIFITIGPLLLTITGLLTGNIKSTTMRYLVPSYLGIQIAVSYLFHGKIYDIRNSVQHRKSWQLATTIIITCGIVSCIVNYQASYWWNKGAFQNLQVANIINRSNQPLLVGSGLFNTDGSIVGNILSLSHILDPTVRLILTIEPKAPNIPNGYNGDIFLYKPSAQLLRRFKKEYSIKPVNRREDDWLWSLTPRYH